MTAETRRNVSMTLFMWITGGLCFGFGGLIGIAWNDAVTRTNEVAARFEQDFRDDRNEMNRIEESIAQSLNDLQNQIRVAQEFDAAHRVRIWDRLETQSGLLQVQNGSIKAVEASQSHIARQVDRLVDRLIGKLE